MLKNQPDKLIEELGSLENEYRSLNKRLNTPKLTDTWALKKRISEVVTRMYTIRGRRSMNRTGDWLKDIFYGGQN